MLSQLCKKVDRWCMESLIAIIEKPKINLVVIVARYLPKSHLLKLQWEALFECIYRLVEVSAFLWHVENAMVKKSYLSASLNRFRELRKVTS